MPTDADYNTFKIIQEILKSQEAINSKKTFELSHLFVEGIISELIFSTNVNTINSYWKKLIWKKALIGQCRKYDYFLQRKAVFGTFDKLKCEELIKNFQEGI